MKKYTAVKNITIMVAMFMVGFLTLANGAFAGMNSGLFKEEMAVKGISESSEHFTDKGVVQEEAVPSVWESELFVEEMAAKGIAESSKHLIAVENKVAQNSPAYPTTWDANSGLFVEELANIGITEQ